MLVERGEMPSDEPGQRASSSKEEQDSGWRARGKKEKLQLEQGEGESSDPLPVQYRHIRDSYRQGASIADPGRLADLSGPGLSLQPNNADNAPNGG